MNKIALVYNTSPYLYDMRRDLIVEFQNHDFEVLAVVFTNSGKFRANKEKIQKYSQLSVVTFCLLNENLCSDVLG